MKKGIFLFSFLFVLGIFAANAQSCHGSASAGAAKSCCASKASKAASTDANIEKRVADDGTVSYVRKESDTQGNVKFVSVQYDEASNTFVNVAPKAITAESNAGMVKKSCTAEEMKACAGHSGSGAKACCAGKEGKSCSAGKESGKACCGKAKVEQK